MVSTSPDAIIVGAGTEVTTGLGTATAAGADASCEVRGLTVSDSLLESSTNIQPKRRFFAIVYFLFWWFLSRGIDSSRIKLTTSMFSGSRTAEYVYIESWSTRITLYTKHPSGISRIGAALIVLTVVGERYWECSSTKVEIVVLVHAWCQYSTRASLSISERLLIVFPTGRLDHLHLPWLQKQEGRHLQFLKLKLLCTYYSMLRSSSSSMASIQGSFTNSSGSVQPVSGTFCVTFSIIQILKVLES